MDIIHQALCLWIAALFAWTVLLIGLTVKICREQTKLTRAQMHQAWWIRRQERERHEQF